MERNRLARQIIDPCREMTRLGLNQGTAGNVSV
ncbi:L-fuculose phosphate aldolase, partial [Klebsiella pneumoniae]